MSTTNSQPNVLTIKVLSCSQSERDLAARSVLGVVDSSFLDERLLATIAMSHDNESILSSVCETTLPVAIGSPNSRWQDCARSQLYAGGFHHVEFLKIREVATALATACRYRLIKL
ncbi:hypothetical protein MRB53_039346 [Persea americana]|nr:hypothetical protein MRB53_039346 [Persea americana]